MLSSAMKKQLKAKAHKLNPVVMIGSKGLTDNVVMETDRALIAHELIKVKISVDDRELRQELADELAEKTSAEFIQMIGRVAILYRENED